MRCVNPTNALSLVAVVLISACAAPQSPTTAPASQPSQPAAPATVKRITAAIRSDPAGLFQQRTLISVGSLRGLDALEELTLASMTFVNPDGARVPQLAEATPSIDNGLWQVFPDGRMETTWHIRADARWHDGAPVSADDLVFTTMVEQDKDVGMGPFPPYALIESIQAPDPRTVTIMWKAPFIDADGMFSYRVAAVPLPKHILEPVFTQDKGNLLANPFWNTDLVGTGAYKVSSWVQDSNVVLQANNDYVLGRPKIDEVDVKFIPDPNTLMANVLAGVELTLGKTISLDQALQIRDQWKDGRVLTASQNWTPISVQFVNSDPPIITNLQFRQAMLYGIDRQQLVDTIFGGQSQVADSYVPETVPGYQQQIAPSVVKYAYDLSRAGQLLEGLGFSKHADGFLYDANNQKLSVQVYTTIQNDIHPKATAAVADYWKQLGVDVVQVLIPIERAQDREYRAQFPAFELVETTNAVSPRDISRMLSSNTPLPENGFTKTGNNSRYSSPELDGLINQYMTTIPLPERMQALAGIAHHLSVNLPVLPLFRGVDPTMVANRIVNVTARGELWTQSWNAQAWDIQG